MASKVRHLLELKEEIKGQTIKELERAVKGLKDYFDITIDIRIKDNLLDDIRAIETEIKRRW